MKTIYFIRHGESEGNVGLARQGAHGSLTERGREQAKFLANRCAKLSIDIVISSTMSRAKETAEIIAHTIQKPLETSTLFLERRWPSEIVGQLRADPKVVTIDAILKDKFEDDVRYSDEENFSDLKKRAMETLDFLKNRPEENILVLTHGFYLKIVIAHAVFGDSLNAHECESFIHAFRMENTGITVLHLDDIVENPQWLLWTWNDHAHLG